MKASVRTAPAGDISNRGVCNSATGSTAANPQGGPVTGPPFQRPGDTAAHPQALQGWHETSHPFQRDCETQALDIAPALTPEERTRLDLLAVSRGATAEGMAAAAVKRLLAKSAKRPHVFRLTMPEEARRKLEEHASALGCQPSELAAFLFSRREARRNAVLTSAG